MNNRFRRLVAVVVAVLLAALLAGAAWSPQTGIIRLDILTVNDFHGALAADGKNPGAAALAAYLKAERAKNPAGTLVLSAGDMFQGSPDSNLLYGKTVVAFMNAVGFDAMVLGNHEFDWGLDVLKERVAQAAFPLLAANIVDKDTGRRAGLVPPYVILEKQGLKIAVVGLITPDTAVTTNPRNVENYRFADPAAALEALLPELKAQGAAVVVALCHLASYPGDEPTGEAADLARAAAGDVAAVVSGHSHMKVAGKVAGVPVVQAYYNGRSVAAIHLAVTASGEVLGATVEVADVPPGLAPDPRTAAIVAAAQRDIAPVKSLVLGRAAEALPHDRYRLSPLGQWATDAMRAAAGADIALCNGGGLRAGLAAGPVTLGDLYSVMPFDNELFVAAMTGAQVMAALEHGLANEKFGTLQFSGLRVVYSAAASPGRRVVSATLADGSPLAPDAVYRVAVSDFLVAGGDEYDMIKAASGHTNTYRSLRDVLAEAVRKAGVIRFKGDGRLREVSAAFTVFIAA
jgi:2',3'-cyclic-nucleotide 2'-phosphodiesterase/3'-nucleotidase